ncbi:MAG: hydrogenase nickel incorporation protein HypB [Sphaerochaetaceae bacterium]
MVKVYEIKQRVLANNDSEADALRSELKQERKFLLNLMSSPGSGKTSVLMKTIALLKDDLKIGVMEADIDSAVDAQTIATTGAKVVQLHTGGMCHLDAGMTRQGLEALDTDGLDLAILENVGNLVCPAEFDTGAVKNAMILSVPEGDDKPLKYPLMFTICSVLLINKIDVLPYFDFDLDLCIGRVKELNPDITVIPVSAKTGEGIDEWAAWLKNEVTAWRDTSSSETIIAKNKEYDK